MKDSCTLCLGTIIFPVRFVSNEHKPMGQQYHLRGACYHLAQVLLRSNGKKPEILDQTRTSVIKLEPVHEFSVGLEAKEVLQDHTVELCTDSAGIDEHSQALALQLEHVFNESMSEKKPFDKEVWVLVCNDYRKAAKLTQECWLKQLYNFWVNIGTGGRTFCFVLGSLAVWILQSIWESTFYPQGIPQTAIKKPSYNKPVDCGKIKGNLQYDV